MQYLGNHLDGRVALQLKAHTVPKNLKEKVVYKKGDIIINAVSVHHVPIPAIAYRVNIGKKSKCKNVGTLSPNVKDIRKRQRVK